MSGKPLVRHHRALSAAALWGALAISACATHYARVPARVDLEPYRRIALVHFTAERDDSSMSSLATDRFAEALLASQRIELLEISAADSSLRARLVSGDAARLARELGRANDVPAVFVGHLKVSDVKPHGRIGASGVNVRGAVAAELSVRLISVETGGTLWRSSAAANGTMGRLHVARGMPSVSVRDRGAAYGEIVQTLVAGVTRDLRPTLVKQ